MFPSVDVTKLTKFYYSLEGADPSSFELKLLYPPSREPVVPYVNECLRNQFSSSASNTSVLAQLESNAKWFAETAVIAAKQQQWSDFEELIQAYAHLTQQAGLILQSAKDQHQDASDQKTGGSDNKKDLYALGIITYSWNAPTAALEYGIAMAPLMQAQKNCNIRADLLASMTFDAQNVRDYVDLLAIPGIRAVLFRRDLTDLCEVGERLAEEFYNVLLRYISNATVMTQCFCDKGVVRAIVEMIRLLQAQFVGNELRYRQRIGLGILSKLISVGNVRNGDGEATWSELCFEDCVRRFLDVSVWDKLMGLTPEQPSYLAMSMEMQNAVADVLEGRVSYLTRVDSEILEGGRS